MMPNKMAVFVAVQLKSEFIFKHALVGETLQHVRTGIKVLLLFPAASPRGQIIFVCLGSFERGFLRNPFAKML